VSAAATFRALHAPGALLVLPNAWDAGSARAVEEAGAPAIATTSAGLAWAHGWPDGGALPPAVVAAAVAEIVRVVRVPVSADVEDGYADAADTVARVLDAGAVGVNLEDGTASPDVLCAKIAAVKAAAARGGHDLFVNARIDVVLRRLAEGAAAVDEVARRVARYRDAGADGVFVPALIDGDAIRTIVAAASPLPLNVLAVPGLPEVATLRALGVRRLSAGAGVARAALATAHRMAAAFLAAGRAEDLLADAAARRDWNAAMRR
jgi:2-methylisocitrate lyase-like PEP mutase family enzyme